MVGKEGGYSARCSQAAGQHVGFAEAMALDTEPREQQVCGTGRLPEQRGHPRDGHPPGPCAEPLGETHVPARHRDLRATPLTVHSTLNTPKPRETENAPSSSPLYIGDEVSKTFWVPCQQWGRAPEKESQSLQDNRHLHGLDQTSNRTELRACPHTNTRAAPHGIPHIWESLDSPKPSQEGSDRLKIALRISAPSPGGGVQHSPAAFGEDTATKAIPALLLPGQQSHAGFTARY